MPSSWVDPLYAFCSRRASNYVPEYEKMVSDDICKEENTGNYASALCYGGSPFKSEICALWDSVTDLEKYMDVDKEELCDSYDEAGNVIPSTVTTVCTAWGDVCTGGIPDYETMCSSLDSVPDSLTDLDIPYFCCEVSSQCVAEPKVFYMELVDPDVCTSDIGQLLCGSAGEPVRGEICALASQYADRIADYVPDVEGLCGYYDESDTFVQYTIHPFCESW